MTPLKYKFLFPLLVLIFAAVFSVGAMTFRETSRELERVVLSDMKTSASLLQNMAESWVSDRHLDISTLASNEVFIKSIGDTFISKASRKVANSRFDEMAENSTFYNRLLLVSGEGKILAASRYNENEALPQTYREFLNSASAEITEPQQVFQKSFRPDGKFRHILIGRLFKKDLSGQGIYPVDGYIIAEVNIPGLVKSIFDPITFGRTGHATLYDDQGINIGQHPERSLYELITSGSQKVATDQIYTVHSGGSDEVMVLKNLESLPWTIALRIRKDEITEPAYRLTYQILVIGLVVTFLATMMTMGFISWILNPIQSLAATAKAVTKEKDYTLRAVKYSNDELGVLVDSFNSMLAEIETYSENLKRAKEEADNANMMKSQFLATMSHEIRTPMNGIFGMTELLLSTHLTEKQKSYAQTVIRSADSLLGILNDILDFSKIEAGKMELDFAPFDLMAVIDDTAEIMAIQAREKAIELIVRYKPGTPQYYIGDSGRIRLILSNLVNNAVKFTEKGYVLIEVEEDRDRILDNDDRKKIRISIKDTGIGITPENQNLIFEKFAQADSSTTRKYGGTGLGLAICKQLSIMMGGDVSVKSEIGRGSEFSFTVMMQEDEKAIAKEDPSVERLKGVNVLIVDDIEVNCELLSDIFRSYGMKSTVCMDSEKAADVMREAARAGAPFHIAVVDYLMPKINGEDLGHIIKQDKEIADTALIMLTSASGVAGYSRRFHEAGYSSFLKKPLRHKELMDTLAHVWKRYAAGDRTSLIYFAGMDEPDKVKNSENIKFHNAKILLAEDNRTNQSFGIEILQSANCTVEIAVNGVEAIRQASNSKFDLIFMDCEMPEMNGYEATQQLTKLMDSGAIKAAPIIALTAHAQSDERQRCLAVGMSDYLSKPIRKAEMLAMIQKWAPDKVDGESLLENRFDGYRVLIVEDNRTNRMMAEKIMHGMGFAVNLAENGAEAVEIVKKITFDLVIMDIQMPVMDGMEATRQIRGLIEQGRIDNMPIIALTANAMEKDREECLAAGMSDYMAKPVKKAAFYNTISKWLEPRNLDKNGYFIGIDPGVHPILDQEILKVFRRKHKKKFFKEAEEYLYQTRLTINAIQEAWKEIKTEEMAKNAHGLLESSKEVGAIQMACLVQLLLDELKKYNDGNNKEFGRINRCVTDSLDKAFKNIAPQLDAAIQLTKQ